MVSYNGDRHILFFFLRKHKPSENIADDSHEMASVIMSRNEKKYFRMSFATILNRLIRDYMVCHSSSLLTDLRKKREVKNLRRHF